MYSTRQISASDEVWHQRLGHPNPLVLQQLSAIKAIFINKSSKRACEACRLGKSSRLPFVASSFVASRPLKRIHCDLWGPSPVLSIQGFRFYVVFIDHYTKFCWFYPLRCKSDFYEIFIKFQALPQNQGQATISTFQCDGGGEFTSHRFLKYLELHGIQQQISCPHTPQQNSLAERKHRQITELGLVLMFHGKVPQKYWVEAFFTANFLSNLLPHTSLTNSKSPYELMYHRPPDYRLLRVFGSACFPMLRDYAQNKLDPRSLQCVFLGYNEKFKGYCCLLPTTGRVYITRHVIFDESSFPFADKYAHFHIKTLFALLSAWQTSFLKAPSISQQPSSKQKTSSVITTLSYVQPATLQALAVSAQSSVESTSTTDLSSLFTPADFPHLSSTALATGSSASGHTSGDTTSCEEHSSECTSGSDPVSIGNSYVSSQDRTVSPTIMSSSPSSPQQYVHPMITRSKSGITKPNPRYALLTQKAVFPVPKTVSEALKHPGWTNEMT